MVLACLHLPFFLLLLLECQGHATGKNILNVNKIVIIVYEDDYVIDKTTRK